MKGGASDAPRYHMKQIREDFIAPCGMNCRLCIGFQRDKNKCLGCRYEDAILYVTKESRHCVIKSCQKKSDKGYCFECESYPCRRLKDLDKRYRTKYHMSMLENLEYIRQQGINSFIDAEEQRWTCPTCQQILCVHRPNCLTCKTKIFDSK